MAREFRFRNRDRERPRSQAVAMRATFPDFKHRITRQGGVRWIGKLRPTIESPWYELVILHELNNRPRTWVISPPLAPNPPHVYRSDDNSLCLYWPKEWCWTPTTLARRHHRPMVGTLAVLLRSLVGHRRVAWTQFAAWDWSAEIAHDKPKRAILPQLPQVSPS